MPVPRGRLRHVAGPAPLSLPQGAASIDSTSTSFSSGPENYGASNDLAQWGWPRRLRPGLNQYRRGCLSSRRAFCSTQPWRPSSSAANKRRGAGLPDRQEPVGVRFGTEGMVETMAIPAGPERTGEPGRGEFPSGKLRVDATSAHVRNFLNCVKAPGPAAAVEVGRSASLTTWATWPCLGRNVNGPPAGAVPRRRQASLQAAHRPLRAGSWRMAS